MALRALKLTRQQMTGGAIGLVLVGLLAFVIWFIVHHIKSTHAVKPTSSVQYMTDAQAAAWAPAYKVLMTSTSLKAAVAASVSMGPLMNLQLTQAQLAAYSIPQVDDATRKVIITRQKTPQSVLDTAS